jgi:hypothetical protein
MAKLGFIIPRTLSNALSITRENTEPEAFHIQDSSDDIEQRLRRRPGWSRSGDTLPQRVVRIGRSIIPSAHGSASTSRATSRGPVPLSTVGTTARDDDDNNDENVRRKAVNDDAQRTLDINRTIRFANEQQPVVNAD